MAIEKVLLWDSRFVVPQSLRFRVAGMFEGKMYFLGKCGSNFAPMKDDSCVKDYHRSRNHSILGVQTWCSSSKEES